MGIKPIIDFEQAGKFSGYEFDWDSIAKNGDNFFVFYGQDDPYVGIGNGTLAAKKLKTSLISVPEAGHIFDPIYYHDLAAIRLI